MSKFNNNNFPINFAFQSGQLNEYTERKDMNTDVVCMALASVPQGEQRSRFLAVGLADNTVRIISLDPNDCLTPLSMQALPDAPESLCIGMISHKKSLITIFGQRH